MIEPSMISTIIHHRSPRILNAIVFLLFDSRTTAECDDITRLQRAKHNKTSIAGRHHGTQVEYTWNWGFLRSLLINMKHSMLFALLLPFGLAAQTSQQPSLRWFSQSLQNLTGQVGPAVVQVVV